ncbi:rRNA/tRNA 2'-O-methyltransferase fibrillarin-like protein 1 [Pseudomyrmex gracilis]|uniref:rRNA/tRNA 2'-O-methyltransferase fibrillarin-like protein 1 n=1 Tax=Pseudomyrmex gracilis TaxID=219809 RepID=UPI0009953959|nr:rRNA/tRNA 2'-O-methyltransferase fibrillarin-like protein 1 [Pseudomyrmex gracilis]
MSESRRDTSSELDSEGSYRETNRSRQRKRKWVYPSKKYKGVFVLVQDNQETLITKSVVPRIAAYEGEKRIYFLDKYKRERIEYRIWDPFKFKLAAAIRKDINNIYIMPKSKVLYLGAESGTAVSHVADIVGLDGIVYAVESVQKHMKQLVEVAQKRSNIVPILEEAWHPYKYRMLIGMVDVIVSDIARPDYTEIVAKNAHNYLKNGGHFVIFIKMSMDPSDRYNDAWRTARRNLENEKLRIEEYKKLDEKNNYIIVGVFDVNFNLEIRMRL